LPTVRDCCYLPGTSVGTSNSSVSDQVATQTYRCTAASGSSRTVSQLRRQLARTTVRSGHCAHACTRLERIPLASSSRTCVWLYSCIRIEQDGDRQARRQLQLACTTVLSGHCAHACTRLKRIPLASTSHTGVWRRWLPFSFATELASYRFIRLEHDSAY
jgi:hypothetical protein